MKILIVDNYDSFTYNLVHLVENITGGEVVVRKNDELEPEEVLDYDRIILSPGPGIPSEAGGLMSILHKIAGQKPILGVCLGHQAIGELFGGKLENLETVFHGVSTRVNLEPGAGVGIFDGLPTSFDAGRYHSWIVSEENLPSTLEITARDEKGYIMAMKHREIDITGVQFHPESILTPEGEVILRNWLFSDKTKTNS